MKIAKHMYYAKRFFEVYVRTYKNNLKIFKLSVINYGQQLVIWLFIIS